MRNPNPRSTASVGGHPIHPMLVYYGQHLDPRVQPQRPDLVAKAIAPDYALSSHVAPLGLVFYTGTNLPTHYRGGAFVGEHGSWDRTVLNGYRIVYVPFENGRPSGPAEDVVTGFLIDGDKARGRPVGLTVDGQGGLLIADDTGNSVWRVSAAAEPANIGSIRVGFRCLEPRSWVRPVRPRMHCWGGFYLHAERVPRKIGRFAIFRNNTCARVHPRCPPGWS
jgi:hypothetical protein